MNNVLATMLFEKKLINKKKEIRNTLHFVNCDQKFGNSLYLIRKMITKYK